MDGCEEKNFIDEYFYEVVGYIEKIKIGLGLREVCQMYLFN